MEILSVSLAFSLGWTIIYAYATIWLPDTIDIIWLDDLGSFLNPLG
jgi:hypothetical protein